MWGRNAEYNLIELADPCLVLHPPAIVLKGCYSMDWCLKVNLIKPRLHCFRQCFESPTEVEHTFKGCGVLGELLATGFLKMNQPSEKAAMLSF